MKQIDPEDKGITIFENVMRLEINGIEKEYITTHRNLPQHLT
jgi:hypothetical protein